MKLIATTESEEILKLFRLSVPYLKMSLLPRLLRTKSVTSFVCKLAVKVFETRIVVNTRHLASKTACEKLSQAKCILAKVSQFA